MTDPKRLVRRLVDAINQGRLDAVDDLFTSPLKERIRQAFEAFRSAFPDWQQQIVELVAEDDTVAVHFRCSGTHLGSFMGFPATGRRMEGVDEVYFLRVSNGKFTEVWGIEDTWERMTQLGLAARR